jgi:hypothetical protein
MRLPISVAVNGTTITAYPGAGPYAFNTPRVMKANQVNNVVFVSTTAPANPNGIRSNQVAFTNNSLALPQGLSYTDRLSTATPYRWATFNTYDQSRGWAMQNNASLFGGVAPSQWTDGNAVASQMSSNPGTLASIFTNKAYAGSNALVAANTDRYYSSTNGQVTAALFQIKNMTSNDVVWTPNFYATSNGAWGENASISANGVNVWSSSANTNGAQAYSAPITLKANQANNVVFTSTVGAAHGSGVRSNQLGFIGNTLALAPGLETIDQLPSNVFRTATFNTYDQNYGWVFNNNAALTGGVTAALLQVGASSPAWRIAFCRPTAGRAARAGARDLRCVAGGAGPDGCGCPAAGLVCAARSLGRCGLRHFVEQGGRHHWCRLHRFGPSS